MANNFMIMRKSQKGLFLLFIKILTGILNKKYRFSLVPILGTLLFGIAFKK